MPATLTTSLQVTLSLSDERATRILRHLRDNESIPDLLLRLLDNATLVAPNRNQTSPERSGFKTKYYNFPEGFEIFRVSNGTRYSARASHGKWITPTGGQFSSLNALSQSITKTSENAWISWSFIDTDGKVKRIDALRDKSRVATRNRAPSDEDQETLTWRDDVYAALKRIGRSATLYEIYRQTAFLRRKRGATLPESMEAIIRRTLEENSSDSDSYKGRANLFRSVNGIGSGVWGLRHESN
ncbi:MAG: hypothetical protein VW600_21105 [Ferrovibrio sp.]